jgi:subtilisin-like proprotein convertase family protein
MVFSFNNRSIIILRYAVILLLLINCYAIGQTQYTSQEFQIPDNTTGVTVGTINITDSGTLKDIHVKVNYNSTTGTNAAEFITLSIISPSGTVVELAKGANITSGNLRGSTLYETMFDDNATTSITSGSQPYTGTYKPIGQFSTLLNESITGQWRLVVNQTSNYSGTFSFSIYTTTDNSTPKTPINYGTEYASTQVTIPINTPGVQVGNINITNTGTLKDIHVTVN